MYRNSVEVWLNVSLCRTGAKAFGLLSCPAITVVRSSLEGYSALVPDWVALAKQDEAVEALDTNGETRWETESLTDRWVL